MNIDYFRMMARYNQWANERMLAACATLDGGALAAPRVAFFPSILKTFNHILVADRLWLARLEGRVEKLALDDVLYPEFGAFRSARMAQDQAIIAFVDALDDDVLATDLAYRNVAGKAFETPRSVVIGHFFNHQTHHRGQLHSMLLEAGCGSQEIDLIYFARLHGYSK
ncbi:DinB family protein [Thalassospira sp.]|uniref:DinB family protein n=1 Tax=Thalassospira sp. TaxID=1912094 RepID=UPI002732C645|nr:DinB family protein [Thalassospira sp.]MDP2698982.1 DinB family protein [Thalassospira sp.]